MISLILLCLVIWGGTYWCLALSGQPKEVKPYRSIDDFFE
ncbi:hypothetical protein J2W98_000330 [Paenibacillus peoriae]|uniref:MetS family NSS transporter small subunit n=1 Tax=Paenibacillus peoriae TaxID=59893 RepID=A0ABU1Q8X0_9BACL|nr:hypothetical protein [Paenibacillus peoriae]